MEKSQLLEMCQIGEKSNDWRVYGGRNYCEILF